MPKGIITQTFVVLFREYIEVASLKPLLSEFNIVKETPGNANWALGGPGLILEYLRKINGLIAVDVVNQPWPDHMGNPKTEMEIFGAWAMGWFGPFTYPGGLERATQQSWQWPEAKSAVPQHAGFLRLRISYGFGLPKDAKCIPDNYDPLGELEFLSALASTLLQHPAALCYFNPSGELLLPKAGLDRQITFAREHKLPALPAWTNVRLFNFDANWLVMDTVGNWQLDMPDQEMAIPRATFDGAAYDAWLRDVSLYVFRKPGAIKDGNTMDRPGGEKWQGKTFPQGICPPLRQVIRWLPFGVKDIPPQFLLEKPAK